jgi:hypothetical protein
LLQEIQFRIVKIELCEPIPGTLPNIIHSRLYPTFDVHVKALGKMNELTISTGLQRKILDDE